MVEQAVVKINYDYDDQLVDHAMLMNMMMLVISNLEHIFVAFKEEFEGAVGPKVVVEHLDDDADADGHHFDQGDDSYSNIDEQMSTIRSLVV